MGVGKPTPVFRKSFKRNPMYFTDKEMFNDAWMYFADNWYDQSKVNSFNEFNLLYSGPRLDICFLENLKSGSYDYIIDSKAKEFFLDNIDSPFMKELYPYSKIITDEEKLLKRKKESEDLVSFFKKVRLFKHKKV